MRSTKLQGVRGGDQSFVAAVRHGRIRRAQLLSVGLALLVAACGGSVDSAPDPRGTTLTYSAGAAELELLGDRPVRGNCSAPS